MRERAQVETWEVRLSGDAEATVRALPPVQRGAAVELLDGLEREAGRDGLRPDPEDPRLRFARAGPIRARVHLDDARRIALVVDLEVGATRPSRRRSDALRALFADLGSDVRVAARSLARAPGFTFATVLTLALALGGSALVLGLLDTVHRSALPFQNADELVRLRTFASSATGDRRVYNMSPRDFLAVRDGNRVFDGVVAMEGGSTALRGEAGAIRVPTTSVSAGWSDVLGIVLERGRGFRPAEEALGPDARVALVSHGVWDRFLEGSPDAIGATLATVDGPLTVVGILPPRFAYPYDAEIWIPGRFDPSNWAGHDLNVVARRADGLPLERVRQDMARLYDNLRADSPGTVPDDGVDVATVRSDLIRDHADPLRGLTAAVAMLLLLACVNVATLLGIRLVARERETTVRAVLGASRLRLWRHGVVEALLLFGAGAAAGLALAFALGDATGALVPDVMRTQLDVPGVRFHPTLVLGNLGLALAAGLLTGGVAAARASREDLQGVLRAESRGGRSRDAGRRQDALVSLEIAMALALLVAAGALFEHFQRLRDLDLGYPTADRLTMQMSLEGPRYGDPETRGVLLRQVEDAVAALPEVASAGLTSVNPLCCGDWGAMIRVEGLERPSDAPPILIHHRYVTNGYFETMDIPIVRGRAFDAADGPDAPRVVIVDEALARRFWPGEDPIGKRLGWDRPGEPLRTVVGVVPRIYREGDYTEGWYLPLRQEPTGRSAEILHLMIEARDDDALAAVRRAVAALDPSLPLFGEASLGALREEAIGEDRVGAVLAITFAAAGLFLACLGLYGLLAYQVALRTREVGTRMALGARTREVIVLFARRSGRLLLVGVGLGVTGALLANRLLVWSVPGVEMVSWTTIAGLSLVLALATLGSGAVPVARAARLDPARTLKEA